MAESGKSASLRGLAPPSPLLYQTQWLPEPIDTTMYHNQCLDGSRKNALFFQNLEELHDLKHAQHAACGGDLLELALLQMRNDQTALQSFDKRRDTHILNSSAKAKSKGGKTRLAKKTSRDARPSLDVTHPALYSHAAQHSTQQTKPTCRAASETQRPGMVPVAVSNAKAKANARDTARATLCQERELRFDRVAAFRAETPYFSSTRAPSADTAHLPLIALDDPSLAQPQPRHLRCDTESASSGLISPVFLMALPFGSMLETASVYADNRCRQCQEAAIKGSKCCLHDCDAGTQGYKPHATLQLA